MLLALISLVMISTSEVRAQEDGTPLNAEHSDPWQGSGLQIDRDALQPRPLPGVAEKKPSLIQVLPPLPALPAFGPPNETMDSSERVDTERRRTDTAGFTLTSIDFRGNTAFSDAELNAVAAPYVGRQISTSELLDLRNQLTAHYVSNGYISSGATIPDQAPVEGHLLIQIMEARLGPIELARPSRLSPRYIEERLRLDAERPFRIQQLERRLRNLQESAPIRRVDVRIEPGPSRTRNRLNITLDEAPAYFAWAEAGTLLSPNLGGYAGRTGFDLNSPFGWAEQFRTQFTLAEGVIDFQGEVSAPIWAYDTRLTLRGRYAESRVVTDPLDGVDLSTKFASAGFELLHPVWRSQAFRLNLGLQGDWRQGLTFLDNNRTSFSEGSDRGRLRVAAIRLFADGRIQSLNQVIGFRSTWSIGIDALGATRRSRGLEDGRFQSWLGQVQLLRSLQNWPIDFLIRGDVQIADDRLLPIERFSTGGANSVRGYRENVLVRDNGASGSLEIRWQALRDIDRRRLLEVFAFVDAGRSWEVNREDNRSDTLASTGLGARYSPTRRLNFEFSYARRLKGRPSVIQDDLQDKGVFFRIQVVGP